VFDIKIFFAEWIKPGTGARLGGEDGVFCAKIAAGRNIQRRKKYLTSFMIGILSRAPHRWRG
jgi:hypothetical protein